MNLVESIQKWLTFRLSAEQEDRFRQANFGADIEQARICILLVVLLIAALVVNDYYFFRLSRIFDELFGFRLVLVASSILFLTNLPRFTDYKSYDLAEFLWGLFVSIVLITMNTMRPETFVAHTIVTVVIVFITILAIPNTFTNQLTLSLVYTVGETLVVVPSLLASLYSATSFTVLFSMLCANSFAITAGWLLHSSRRTEFLAREDEHKAKKEAEMQLAERKHAEEMLLRKKEELDEAQRISHVGSWYWDTKTDNYTVSDELPRIFGQVSISPFQKQKETMYPPESWRLLNLAIQRAVQTGVGYELDLKALHGDGYIIWITIRGKVVRDACEVTIGLHGTIQDITERKKYEEAIKEAHNSLETLVNERTEELKKAYEYLEESRTNLIEAQKIASLGNWNWYIVTNELYWSDEIYRIFGCTPQEFGATYDAFLRYVHPDDRDYVDNAVKRALKGKPYNIDHRIILANGEERVVNEQAEVIFDEKNIPIRMKGTVQDITKRKKAEEALANIQKSRKKEINHRIKNNLQVISSLLDLQAEKFRGRKGIKDYEVLEAFRESQCRVKSMALIHEELHKGRGGDTVDFLSYLAKLVESLFQIYKLGNNDVNLNMDLEENLFFDMDTAVPLGMIVNELVSNSLKHAFPYKSKGEIQIKLRREENKNEGFKSACFTLKVSDNGVGIPENFEIEDLNSLGFQLVASLVDQLDGKLDLKSDKGTKFTMRFTVIEKLISIN